MLQRSQTVFIVGTNFVSPKMQIIGAHVVEGDQFIPVKYSSVDFFS